jgi:heme exporter protein A
MAARLAFERVACIRGGRLLFERLSFGLGAGDAALLTGPNGAGKSSLIRIAAGLLRPAAGRVDRDGGVALTGESAALDARLPLIEALRFWARLDGVGDGEIAAASAAMGIGSLADVPVHMLSTGQRRRAALARVIAGRDPIWLLDEPGNGLDAASLDRLAAAIAAHRARGGIALVATHQPLAVPGAIAIELDARR